MMRIIRRVATLFALSTLPLFATGAGAQPFEVEVVGDFDEPWTVVVMPDGRLLVTQKTARC